MKPFFNTLNLKTFILSAVMLVSSSAQAELALAVQPNTPSAEDTVFYQGFADMLSEVLDEDVVFLPEKSWSIFRRKLIANEYDLIIAEPHIAALLALNLGNGGLDFSPIVGVPDKVAYKVITTAESDIQDAADLNGKRVCTPLSPALAAVAFLNKFKDDPVNPPLMVESKRGVDQSYQSMLRGRCDAMVVTALELEKLKMASGDITTVFTTREYPSWTLTISPLLTPQRRQQIADVLLNMESSVVQELYKKLSKTSGQFEPQSKSTVAGYNILTGVVWGW